jgi:hypothetical protein
MTAARYYTAHSIDRAWEHYGLALSAADMLEILRATKDGRATKMWTNSHGAATTFFYSFKGRTLFPVVDVAAGCIITFRDMGVVLKNGHYGKRYNAKQKTSCVVDGPRPDRRAKTMADYVNEAMEEGDI